MANSPCDNIIETILETINIATKRRITPFTTRTSHSYYSPYTIHVHYAPFNICYCSADGKVDNIKNDYIEKFPFFYFLRTNPFPSIMNWNSRLIIEEKIEDTKGVIRNRTSMDSNYKDQSKKKPTQGQTKIYKTLHRKLKIKQHGPHKKKMYLILRYI